MPSARPGAVGHHRIGARALARAPRASVDDDDLGAVHLRQSQQAVRLGAQGAGGAGAVLQHGLASISAREVAIEARERAGAKRRRGG